jgi:hypothetical protein
MVEQQNTSSNMAGNQDKVKRRLQKNQLATAFMEHGRIPPQAVDLEEAVLGSVMLEKDALSTVIDALSPEDFYKESDQRIFAAVHRLFTKSEPVDILTVTSELKSSGELEYSKVMRAAGSNVEDDYIRAHLDQIYINTREGGHLIILTWCALLVNIEQYRLHTSYH